MLNEMFVLAIMDFEEEELVMARDRLPDKLYGFINNRDRDTKL